ncbi:MAG: GIN domain-containing protein [Parvularculaceae bacterium]
MKLYISAIVLTAFLVAPAAAKDVERSFRSADGVVIEDFTGAVEVKVGGSSVSLTLTDGAKTYPVEISERNGMVYVAGENRPRRYRWHEDYGRKAWRDEDAFKKYLADYPVLKITAPAGANLKFDRAIVMAKVGDLNGDVKIHKGYVEARIGDVVNADIGISGSGDVTLGAVSEVLHLAIGGSGDFEGESAGQARLAIGGSGDIDLGPVAGDTDITIGGSGDVETGDIGGALAASIGGSGDIRVGAVGSGAILSISGSGDINLDSVNGETSASIAGGGDIGIAGGRAQNLRVSIAGSGDFTFGGVSTNLNASVNGSGSVTVAENEGALQTSGRGDFRVGGVRIRQH